MRNIIKNIILFSLIIIEIIFTNTSSFALCYSSKTNGEEIHQRSCVDIFQATGLLTVFFEDGDLAQMGTATLIAPDVLITAAHVLVMDEGKQIKEICFQPLCNPELTFTQDMGQRPKNVWIHPDYNHDIERPKHDIAIIQLAQPFKHIRPAQLQKTLPDDFYSARTTVVGYGQSGNNLEGPIFTDWKRRAGHMELLSDFSKKDLLYNRNESRFSDSSDGSKCATIVAHGDSGGPAFIEINGEPSDRILGIAVATDTIRHPLNGFFDSTIPSLNYFFFSITTNKFMSIPYYYSWIESKLRLCNYSEIINNEQSVVLDYNKNTMS